MSRHVIVISQDALVFEDCAYLQTLPNFASIWPQTARVDKVLSVYPTVTYPCHATMMTGLYPDAHGIVNNERAIPGSINTPWHHFRRDVRGQTVFDAAKAAGLSTAAVFWPVTGCDPAIDHLIDEYWPQGGEDTAQCFRDSGSSEDVIDHIIRPNMGRLAHRTHPFCDAFVNACTADVIRRYKPDLLMAHPANIDACRHRYGAFSPMLNHSLSQIDLWLGDIFKATEDAGIRQDTDFFIVSDHGQLNIFRVIALNCLLAEAGLIQVNADGSMGDYVAYAKSAALSAQIYMKDPQDAAAKERVYATLCRLRDDEVYGISQVFTADEARLRHRLAGDFSFVVESDGATSFSNAWTRPLVRGRDVSDYKTGWATHGHLPEKGPQPTLIAFGPGIQPGVVLPAARLIDEAPTFAHALGLSMPGAEGSALTALFRK